MATLTAKQEDLLKQAKQYFVGHTEAVGVLLVDAQRPMFLKSGIDGGPWGGTHRGGVPRGRGAAYTSGGPSQGNIATHVEGHAAAIMWQREFRKATLLVDRAMCNVCSRDLPTALPPGARMTVISEDEGETFVCSTHTSKAA